MKCNTHKFILYINKKQTLYKISLLIVKKKINIF